MVKIVTGGQTGVDRAALDWAIANSVAYRGWIPAGRRSEDGSIPQWYNNLQETRSAEYAERTELNVRTSEATVVFSLHNETIGGTQLTETLARQYRKPLLHLVCTDASIPALADGLSNFVSATRCQELNIAGPRASQEPGLSAIVTSVLNVVFRREWKPIQMPMPVQRRYWSKVHRVTVPCTADLDDDHGAVPIQEIHTTFETMETGSRDRDERWTIRGRVLAHKVVSPRLVFARLECATAADSSITAETGARNVTTELLGANDAEIGTPSAEKGAYATDFGSGASFQPSLALKVAGDPTQ